VNLPVPVAVGIWVLIGVLLLLVVIGGRRRLAQRTRGVVPAPPAVPADLGARRVEPVEATYVTTTLGGDWLARVGAHGLGDRSVAAVSVHDAGVLIERTGADPVFVPAAALRGAGLAPGMAGKFVGTDSIVVLSWLAPADATAPATVLDTGVRPRHPADRARLVEAVRALAAGTDPETPAAPPKENQ
jgi:hypothetical protein